MMNVVNPPNNISGETVTPASGVWNGTITAANASPLSGPSDGVSSVQIPWSPTYSQLVISLTGSWAATLVVQISNDNGKTWVSLGSPTVVGSTSAWGSGVNGAWTTAAFGVLVRVTATAFSSGPINVSLSANQAGGGSSGGSGGNVTISAPLGSALSSASVSTVIASDQLPIAVKAAGTQFAAPPANFSTTDWTSGSTPALPTNVLAIWVNVAPGSTCSVKVDGGGATGIVFADVQGGWFPIPPGTNITKIYSPANGSTSLAIATVVS